MYRVSQGKEAVSASGAKGAVTVALVRALLLVAGVPACSNLNREPPPAVDVTQVFARVPPCNGVSVDAAVPSDADAAAIDQDAGGDTDAGTTLAPPVGAGKVVIISVDGLRPDALFRAPAPQILAQACRGRYTWQARTIFPSLTLPAHASMISGVPAEVHGIFHDDNLPSRGVITVPTVLGLAHQAGKRVVVVVGKEKMGQLAPPGTRDVYRWIDGSDAAVVDAALAEVAVGFDLLFVHLPGVDYAGHLEGWLTGAYLGQVRAADQAVGRLLQGLPPEASVILTADHGGAGYGHGSARAEDAFIPWIISGPGIIPSPTAHALIGPVATVDTAATAAQLLGLQLPAGAPGRPITEAWAPAP